MRLLFDHNLSPRLVSQLADLFPGAEHVYTLGLHEATDRAVWQFASEQGYTIVSRDADFSELAVLQGFPPKVVWIRRGNCSTVRSRRYFAATNQPLRTWNAIQVPPF